MKKIILSTLTIFSLSSLTANLTNTNSETKINQQNVNSVLNTVAQKFESNPNKKINYISLINEIIESKFFEKLNSNINIFNGNQIIRDHGYFDTYNSNDFTYDGTKYEASIFGNTLNSFIKIFKQNTIYSTSHTLKFTLTLSIISELVHYYSINNNIPKISDSINAIKDLIQDYKNDSAMTPIGSFITKVQSWNLNSIINDYNNKIYTNEIDKYRTINYDNLGSTTDFDSQFTDGIKNTPISWQWHFFLDLERDLASWITILI